MPRSFYEPRDPDDMFDDAPKHDRRGDAKERMRAEVARRNAEQDARDAEGKERRRERVKDVTIKANEAVLISEYQRAGVTPPYVDSNGVPTVSLSLLLSRGWEIVPDRDQTHVLVAPAPKDEP